MAWSAEVGPRARGCAWVNHKCLLYKIFLSLKTKGVRYCTLLEVEGRSLEQKSSKAPGWKELTLEAQLVKVNFSG